MYPNLSFELDKAGITTAVLAEKLETSEVSVCSKMRGEIPWKLWEAMTVCQMLGNPNIPWLFLFS